MLFDRITLLCSEESELRRAGRITLFRQDYDAQVRKASRIIRIILGQDNRIIGIILGQDNRINRIGLGQDNRMIRIALERNNGINVM
ncbi:MAG: hypothetical protein DRP93_02525 [Candidatus Neomarinimicrobiota bacterium]|nr:MAG: hypothetical protein DRP93_02525 [Candidatus Neomarinimicrobiota bacterium]